MILRDTGATEPMLLTACSPSMGASKMPRRFPKRAIKCFAESFYIRARYGQCQEEFDDLIVREPLKAGLQEALAQPLPMTDTVAILVLQRQSDIDADAR
jgi:hypothetical protein